MSAVTRIHIINFFRKFAVNSVFFLTPLYFLKIGLAGWQIGVIISLYAFAPLLSSFPAGWINDRLSIKKVIQGALVLLSLLLVAVGRSHSFVLTALLFLLIGVANNALDVSTNSLYYKDETALDQNKKYSRLAFWLALGTACGTLVGGLLIYLASFQALFYAYAAILLAVLSITGRLGDERFGLVTLSEYRSNLLRRKTLLFSLLIFILALHWGVEGTVYSPFLRQNFGLNNLQLALFMSLALLAMACSAFFVGLLKTHPAVNKRVFIISMLLSGLGLALMATANVYLSFFFRAVHEVGDGMLSALVVLFISRLFAQRTIGGSSGLLLAIQTLGNMVGSLVFSPLGYNIGLQYPFLIAGGLLVMNSGFAYFVFKREKY